MRVFVGYGYNDRDSWIEEQVFPILRSLGFTVTHGRDLHGEVLQDGVRRELDRSDAAVGFFTLRDGQGNADFNSHIWVRDEMVYFTATNRPIVPIKEDVVNLPQGLLGNRGYIPLRQDDRLTCVRALVEALGKRNIKRLKLKPPNDQLRQNLHGWLMQNNSPFEVRYRTQDAEGNESDYREGRLEEFDQNFFLNIRDMPRPGFVEIVGLLNGVPQFSSGWASAGAVEVSIS